MTFQSRHSPAALVKVPSMLPNRLVRAEEGVSVEILWQSGHWIDLPEPWYSVILNLSILHKHIISVQKRSLVLQSILGFFVLSRA
jgi:hypothetical protein